MKTEKHLEMVRYSNSLTEAGMVSLLDVMQDEKMDTSEMMLEYAAAIDAISDFYRAIDNLKSITKLR